MKDNDTSIREGQVAVFHFTLTDDDGEVLDTSRDDGPPIAVLMGADNVVPGLEKAILEHSIGDSFEVTVLPEDGYGPSVGPGPQPVPREAFPAEEEIEVNMMFLVEGEGGEPVPIWVVGTEGDQVMVDSNHPLAGETLHFSVELVSTREPTPSELEHGHPHGVEGTEEH